MFGFWTIVNIGMPVLGLVIYDQGILGLGSILSLASWHATSVPYGTFTAVLPVLPVSIWRIFLWLCAFDINYCDMESGHKTVEWDWLICNVRVPSFNKYCLPLFISILSHNQRLINPSKLSQYMTKVYIGIWLWKSIFQKEIEAMDLSVGVLVGNY